MSWQEQANDAMKADNPLYQYQPGETTAKEQPESVTDCPL